MLPQRLWKMRVEVTLLCSDGSQMSRGEALDQKFTLLIDILTKDNNIEIAIAILKLFH